VVIVQESAFLHVLFSNFISYALRVVVVTKALRQFYITRIISLCLFIQSCRQTKTFIYSDEGDCHLYRLLL